MYVRFGRFLEFDQMQHVVPNVSTKDDTYEIKGKAMIVQRRQTIESELLLLVVQRPYHTMVRCCLLERTKNFEKRPCAKDDARLVRFDRTPKKKKKRRDCYRKSFISQTFVQPRTNFFSNSHSFLRF